MQLFDKLFFKNKRPDFVIIGLFFIINSIVIVNAIWHHPKIGYDATEHLTYIQVLLSRLPNSNDTAEFFSPPLPYFAPAIYDNVCKNLWPGDTTGYFQGIFMSFTCRFNDGKFAQAMNVLLSFGSIFTLLAIAEQIRPGNRWVKISLLSLLGLLTVYYKTFSQVRGEPYVFFFMSLSIYFVNKLIGERIHKTITVITLGVTLGCLILSRQWGFFIFPAIALLFVWIFITNHPLSKGLLISLIASCLISFFIGSWFYFSLYYRYGSFTAFNISSHSASSEQIGNFFRATRIKNFELFRFPIRPNFENEFFPILYSETWGDYWGYFVQIKNNSSFGDAGYKNEKKIAGYLGKVNLFSLVPSIILLMGVATGSYQVFKKQNRGKIESYYYFFMLAVLIFSFAGFVWFILNYFIVTDDTIKATYILQMFIPLLFLGTEFMEQIRKKSRTAFYIILGFLGIVFLHNLPAFITRYNMFYILK